MATRDIGFLTEKNACQFLQDQGLSLLMRNYHCIFGEIDLIMRDGDFIVFVEVRRRANEFYASAKESVNRAKQLKLTKTATHFLQKKGWYEKVPCRFDIIASNGNQFEWIKNAF